jgi:hypothetical protein
VVSIAEPFNYRIFERKRRLEEGPRGSTPSMPCSQCRTKTKQKYQILCLTREARLKNVHQRRRCGGSFCARLRERDNGANQEETAAALSLSLTRERERQPRLFTRLAPLLPPGGRERARALEPKTPKQVENPIFLFF